MAVVDVSAYFAGVDPLAETKTVIFRPSTTTDAVRVGDLVCYNWDLTTDYKERSTNPSGRGATYAEGSQNYTGRIFVVEKPATANLQFFAGVVAKLGPEAGTDGDTIVIYRPNGAVVPVMCDQYCTNGRTIVAVRNGAYEGSYPSSAARPIGIAMETKDRSTTDGLVWTKLDPNMFAWHYHSSALNIDDEIEDNDCIINRLNYTSAQTGGKFTALKIDVALTGGAGSAYGYAFTIDAGATISADTSENICTAGIGTTFSGGTISSNKVYGLDVTMESSGANLSSITGSGVIAPLALRFQLSSTTGPGSKTQYMMYLRSEGGANDQPDGLFKAYTPESIGMLNAGGGATANKVIPIEIEKSGTEAGAGTYYILVASTYSA